jgi:hypothetical protein
MPYRTQKVRGDYVEVKEHYMCDHMLVLIRIVSLGREPTNPKPMDLNCGTNNCQYDTRIKQILFDKTSICHSGSFTMEKGLTKSQEEDAHMIYYLIGLL